MSSWGRCQNALHDLYELDCGYSGTEDGPVKKAGISWDVWDGLIEPIIEAVYPIAYQQGLRGAVCSCKGQG